MPITITLEGVFIPKWWLSSLVDMIYKYEFALRLLAFIGGFGLLATWEYLNPKRKLSQNKSRRWVNNIALVIFSTVLVRLLIPTAAIGSAYLVEQNQWGIINTFELPALLKFVIAFLLLDLFIYWQHAMFHVLPVLWRFHRVHHADMDIDVSTGLRFHPVEIFLSIMLKIFIIVMLGAPLLAVILFEVILNLSSMFTHSNINLNAKLERILRWFIVTPDMHRIHHSVRENETNSNFCFNLSLWDRIFGTYIHKPKDGQMTMTIGLEHFRDPEYQKLKSLLFMPFSNKVTGYAINSRDTGNAEELASARLIARQNQDKASLATELSTYLDAIGQHALVSATDAQGNIIHVNDKFCEVSGYGRDELLGQNHRVINSGVHPPAFFEDLWQQIRSGHNWHAEICNRAKNGELYWVDSTIVPLKNTKGEIERYISVRIDITEHKRRELEIAKANRSLEDANAKLQQLSRIDGLTNIANRRYFDETLAQELSRMRRNKTPLTLILCDIDYFKKYNDRYGHQMGDKCLQQVAQCIHDSFSRTGDLVARYGGEEFTVILPDVSQEAAINLAESLRLSIKDLNIEHESSLIDSVLTLSIGVTTAIPDNDSTVASYIHSADKALYRAKESGRDNIQFMPPEKL